MESIKIKKASIKDDLFLNVEFTEELQGHNKKETKLSCTVPVHADLKDAFAKLHVHLAILCDEVKEPKRKDFDHAEFEGFMVRGFTIGGSDEHEGVTITGGKEGTYGDVNLNTPFTKFESTEYPFAVELVDNVDACIKEVKKYLFDGKRAPEAQLDMFDNDDEQEQGSPVVEEAV